MKKNKNKKVLWKKQKNISSPRKKDHHHHHHHRHQKEEQIKREIVSIADAIRRKRLELKLGRSAKDEELRKTYRPITESLHKIASAAPPIVNVKMEPLKAEKKEIKHEESTQTVEPEAAAQSSTSVFEYDPLTDEDHEEIAHEKTMDEFRREYQTMIDENPARVDEFLGQYAGNAQVYIDGLLTDTTGDYDTTTGVKYDSLTNKFMLGKSLFEIDEKEILIDGIRYKGTAGLFELIFKSRPTGYTKRDELSYKDILNRTSVHRRNHNPQGQVKGSRSYKYINIIQPLTFRHRAASAREPLGHGLPNSLIVDDKPLQYVYWDDINELVDRLRLLTASKQAGNTSHNNEIVSILEELREAGVII